MVFDLDLIKKTYAEMPAKIAAARKLTGSPLTLAEKILYSHLLNLQPALMKEEKTMWILHLTV